MNQQMDLLYLENTGHVLAAFTRVGEPKEPEASADVFTGDKLLVNGLGDPTDYTDFNSRPPFQIPSALVSLFRGYLDESELKQPRNLCMDVTKSPPTVGTASGEFPTFRPSDGMITIDHAAPAELAVTVIIEGQTLQDPVVAPPAKITANTTSCPVSVGALSTGKYYALVFVQTWPVSVTPFDV